MIELLIAVAVVAVLVAIAVPAYTDAIRKGRRGQAKSDLVELAQRAERFRTVNNSYTGFALVSPDDQSPRDGTSYYDVALINQTAATYTLTATPKNGQENDTRCMTLSLNQAGVKNETGSGTVADCW